MKSIYSTGLLDDAFRSLSRCEEEVTRFRHDPHALKWLIISLHCMIQSFMANVLDQGNGLQVMRPDAAKKWLKAHDGDQNYPSRTDMDYFLSLYEKIKDSNSFLGYTTHVFVSIGHDDVIEKLNRYRNQFIHMNVSSFRIGISGLHEVIAKSLDIVEYCRDSPAFPWHQLKDSESRREALNKSVSKLRNECLSPFVI
jgi:hypothetical protein